MDITEIKQNVSLVDFLKRRGHQPTRKNGRCLFYRATWRGGDNPTNVKVDTSQEIWYDYAEGVGGSVIELCMHIDKVSKATALKTLTEMANTKHPSDGKPLEIEGGVSVADDTDTDTAIKITRVQPIFYFPLKNYILSRGISVEVASKYCKEIHYSFGSDGKKGWGIGFPTINGFWVLRNAKFKGCTHQDISVIPLEGSKSYIVFEGFFDFLSFVEMYGSPKLNVIVLNSIVNTKRAYPFFDNAEHIYLCLDNDEKGKETTRDISAMFYNKVVDKSGHYANCKDFNEYLIQKRYERNNK